MTDSIGDDMTTSHTTPSDRASKTQSIVLQRLAPVGTQTALAVTMGVSDSIITRLKEKLGEFAAVLAHLGLKVVPAEMHCVDAGHYRYLCALRRRVEDHAPHLLE